MARQRRNNSNRVTENTRAPANDLFWNGIAVLERDLHVNSSSATQSTTDSESSLLMCTRTRVLRRQVLHLGTSVEIIPLLD